MQAVFEYVLAHLEITNGSYVEKPDFVDKRDSQRRQVMIQDSFRIGSCFGTESNAGHGVGVFRIFSFGGAPAQRA